MRSLDPSAIKKPKLIENLSGRAFTSLHFSRLDLA